MALVAVLDACVLVPAALRDTLLRAATEDLYQPAWSDEILAELERTVVREAMMSQAKAETLLKAIRSAFDGATISDGYKKLIPVMENDPGDRHVLAAAVYSQSRCIVTQNIRHFPAGALEPFSVEALTPDAFLLRLFDDEPDAMCEIIVEQAHDLIGITVRDVLDNVGREAPRFAIRTRERLGRIARYASHIGDLGEEA